jgi:hypothetical protein
MSVRTDVRNQSDGSVSIKLYADVDGDGSTVLVAAAVDDGSLGGAPLTAAGRAGIRTDFMDAKFDDYLLQRVE